MGSMIRDKGRHCPADRGGDLFEEMRCRLRCTYISDIPAISDKERIRSEYDRVPKDRYPEGQYREFEWYAGIWRM